MDELMLHSINQAETSKLVDESDSASTKKKVFRGIPAVLERPEHDGTPGFDPC